jgi:hypothetical protein
MPQERQVAIVGVGQTDFGALYRNKGAFRDACAFGAEALRLALDDAGPRKDEADGPLTARIGYERGAHVLVIPSARSGGGTCAQWLSHQRCQSRPPVWRHSHSASRIVCLPAHSCGSHALKLRASGLALRLSQTVVRAPLSLAPYRSRATGSARPAHA